MPPQTEQIEENKDMSWLMIAAAVVVIAVIGIVIFLVVQNNNSTSTNISTTNNTTNNNVEDDSKQVTGEKKTFTLSEQNSSGQNGSVVLEEVGSQVQVTITLSSPTTTEEPVHIHTGSCPTPGAVKFPLEPVVNGSSVSMIDTSFEDLGALGDLALNVHKSIEDSNIYYSCGDLSF